MKKAAEALRRNKEGIIALWEETMKKEMPVAEKTERLILLNIVPNLLDDFIDIFKRAQDEIDLRSCPDFNEVVEESLDHGRHRATTAHFSSQKIIREYMVLHRVLIMFLKAEKAFHEEVGVLLSLALETSMAYSVDSFNTSLQEMREKLIATLAHDIRNPLSAANLGLSSLRYEDGQEHFYKVSETAGKNVRKAIDLVEDLLDTITVRSGEGISMEFEEHNIVEDVGLVVKEAVEGFKNQIFLHHTENEIKGIFASTAIRRVVENLISNAIKYGNEEKPITVNVVDAAEKVVLKVHNYGNCISQQDREEIFNFLSHSEKESPANLRSWGIGLAFVKMAAEAHGGHVEIESEQGKGTTFSVILHKHFNTPGKKRARLNAVGGDQ